MTKDFNDNASPPSKPPAVAPATGDGSEATLPDPAIAGPGKTLLDSPERQAQIEDLRRERQALEETAARYRAILDASPDPICLTRLDDGKYIFVNTAFYERTGFTPEQIAKYTSIELNVYTGPGERSRLISRLKRDGQVENMEMTIRSKRGAIVSDLWSLRIIDYAGEPHLLLIARNYSQLRAAQQALMESEASYRSILESTPYAIVVTRLADSHYMQVNEAFCRLTGYSRDEVLDHTPDELKIYVDPAARQRMLERFKRDGRVDSMEIQFRAKDGSLLENLFSATPITYKGEACLLAITVDISELKTVQRALKQSEEKYRNILMNMEEGYWEMDLRGTFTFVNEAECRLHRRPLEEIIGQRSRGFYSPETDARISAIFNRVYKTGIPAPLLDLEINRGDGSCATIESSASLLKDAAGTAVGFFGITRDISEKRKVEKELEQYRKHLEQMVQERTRALEEAQGELVKREKLSTLGQLTATVSHELRNPLGVIRSSNFYLQRKIKIRDEKIDKHFKRIEEQVALCDNIVNDLLEYTQGRSVSVAKGPIHPWLERLIEQIEETRSITIERRLSGDLPPIAHDSEKLRRVFINLIENALQAVKSRDESIEKPREDYRPRIHVTARREGDRLVVAVADNGVGMDAKTRGRAFEPLFTTRARGTGIGLAIVQKIIDEHGGEVALESEPGKGTTVTIALPCG